MADALRRRHLTQRLSWIAAILSLGAVFVALVAAIGSGQGMWHFRTGFALLEYMFFAAIAGAVFALIALVLAGRNGMHALVWLNLIALIVALGYVFYLGSMVTRARSVAPIHDITTNLDDPPSFYRLRVRDDNLAYIPDLGRPALARLTPRERWRAIHAEEYGDLKSLHLPWSKAETVSRIEALMRERGWEIATVDPGTGIVEGVDTSLFFRFKDNVVARVRDDGAGGSIVDFRSISRVGQSDVGANAQRIRRLREDLRAAA
jgi:hypothetical protein